MIDSRLSSTASLVLILLTKEDVPDPMVEDTDLIVEQTLTILGAGLRA